MTGAAAGGETREPGRIVVGVDGSEPSNDALRAAAKQAAQTGATLVAVRAWEFPVNFGWSFVPVGYSPKEEDKKSLTEAVDQVFGAQRPAGLELVVAEGNPARILLSHAVGAELLVVGSHGHGAIGGFLLGSTSLRCAGHAPCPVLIVRPVTETAAA